MKAVIRRFAFAMGAVLIATPVTGTAFAACSALAVTKPDALFMPRSSNAQPARAPFLSGSVSTDAKTGTPLSTKEKASDGGPPIVGLWNVLYSSTQGAPSFQTYQQFHTDGLEIETPEFTGVCMGTWEQTTEPRTVKIFHVGFTGGAIPGTYRFELRELDTVSPDRKTFEGVYDQKFFDREGNLVLEDRGTLHGTRLSVDLY